MGSAHKYPQEVPGPGSAGLGLSPAEGPGVSMGTGGVPHALGNTAAPPPPPPRPSAGPAPTPPPRYLRGRSGLRGPLAEQAGADPLAAAARPRAAARRLHPRTAALRIRPPLPLLPPFLPVSSSSAATRPRYQVRGAGGGAGGGRGRAGGRTRGFGPSRAGGRAGG